MTNFTISSRHRNNSEATPVFSVQWEEARFVWDDGEMSGGEEDGWLIRREQTERSRERVASRPEAQTPSDQCK